jgi:hypothetical protein
MKCRVRASRFAATYFRKKFGPDRAEPADRWRPRKMRKPIAAARRALPRAIVKAARVREVHRHTFLWHGSPTAP